MLLPIWWWRFGEEKEALWRRIIDVEYGEDKQGWLPKSVPRSRMFDLLVCISSFMEESNVRGYTFSEGVGFLVEEGCEVLFDD